MDTRGSSPPLAPGGRLGRYELVSLLGRGGAGEVWEAVLTGPRGFRKPVAVKVLLSGPVDDALVEEARLGAFVCHPNVVATWELGEVDGRLILSMELVRGTTAAALGRDGPLPPAACRDLGIQIARGLEHLHTLDTGGGVGLVHRDVKPGNVLVDRQGTARLADLGIARLVGGPGAPAGTPGFLAPEQLLGTEGPPADIFALGVTLAALATRHRPFGRGTAALAALADPEVSWRAAGMPERLAQSWPAAAATLGRCVARDPALRPTAAELAEVLRATAPGPGPDLAEVASGGARRGVSGDPFTPSGPTVPTRVAALGSLPPRADLLGRAEALATVGRALRAGRWVTVVGPGGTGKTRLAVEAARAADPAGGAWFCDASNATDAAGIAREVARTLGATPGDAVEDDVGHALAARGAALLVADNLEQVAGPAAALLSRWLARAPDLRILATSQVPLHGPGEQIVLPGPLSPDAAVELFQRRSPRPPSPTERATVAAICAELDHLPLAIELAAAWTRLLPLPDLHAGLRDRFRLLVEAPDPGPGPRVGAGSTPARHRSLDACLAHTWGLLGPRDRAIASAWSVFVGSFPFPAAERVAPRDPGAPWILDELARLVDFGVLQVTDDRFSLPSSVRAFAAARAGPAAVAAAERVHGAWYAEAWGAPVLAELGRTAGGAGWDRLGADVPDLTAAARRAVGRADRSVAVAAAVAVGVHAEARGPVRPAIALATEVLAAFPDADAVARVAAGLQVLAGEADGALATLAGRTGPGVEVRRSRALRERDRLDEAHAAALRAVATAVDPVDAAEALDALGHVQRMRLSFGEAIATLRGAHDRARAIGDPHLVARTASSVGAACLHAGDSTAAGRWFQHALTAAREDGDRRGEAAVLANLGLVWFNQGETERSRRALTAALDLARGLGHRATEARILTAFAALEPPAVARSLLRTALALHRELGNRRSEVLVLGNLGQVSRDEDPVAALALLEEALAGHRALGNTLDEAVTCNTIGDVHRVAGRLRAAADFLGRALDLSRAGGFARPRIQACLNLADLLGAQGDAEGVKEALREALSVAEATGDGRAAEIRARLGG